MTLTAVGNLDIGGIPTHAQQIVTESEAACKTAKDCLEVFHERSSFLIQKQQHYLLQKDQITATTENHKLIIRKQMNHTLYSEKPDWRWKPNFLYEKIAKTFVLSMPWPYFTKTVPKINRQWVEDMRPTRPDPWYQEPIMPQKLSLHVQEEQIRRLSDPKKKLEALVQLIHKTQEEIQKVFADIVLRVQKDGDEIQEFNRRITDMESQVSDWYSRVVAKRAVVANEFNTTEARFKRLCLKAANSHDS